MRLNSTFKDYYDGVAYGGDGWQWVRITKRVNNRDPAMSVFSEVRPHWLYRRFGKHVFEKPELFPVVLYLCGRMVFGVRTASETHPRFFWSPEALYKAIPEAASWMGRDARFNNGPDTDWRENIRSRTNADKNLLPLHLAAASPVVFVNAVDLGTARGDRQPTVQVFNNPCLKDIDFTHIPLHQMWQDLSMYVENDMAMGSTPAPRPITDELRAETHGFDKQSFKNQKNRQKGNRHDW